MSSRSGAALAVGAVALVGAWLFGTVALASVGFGIVAGVATAQLWRRGQATSLRLTRAVGIERLVEGGTLRVRLDLSGGLSRAVRATAQETVGSLGVFEVPLRQGHGELLLDEVPRGVHELGPAQVVLEDPLGLEQVVAAAPASGRVTVRPRVVEIEALFSDTGRSGFGGRRAALRRPAGVDLHAVRDYQHGEPMRLVHWPTTARRATLSVRELEDTPREGTTVVLDCCPEGQVGPTGSSSFDEAVRATASIVHARASRVRPVTLVTTSGETTRVRGLDRTYDAALDLLAGVRPTGQPLASVLADPRSGLGRRSDLVVVSCSAHGRAVELLAGMGRGALVAIDAPTYAGAPATPAAPGLLRLVAAGVPVAVVRAGDDLGEALSGLTRGDRSA